MVGSKVVAFRTRGQTTPTALVLLLLLGCASARNEAPAEVEGDRAVAEQPARAAPDVTRDAAPRRGPTSSARTAPVVLGVDVLLRDSLHLLDGRRVGLITNHTGVSGAAAAPGEVQSTIDLLHRAPDVELVALYSPEHGITGRAEAGERVASGRDPRTGLPIHSLYHTSQKPTAEMLAGVDVLVFDIQDIGARYYTYVWTMALAMSAAAEAGLPFVVLDRPNPIGGHIVQGNVLDPAYATFVGLYPVPMRHGLTAGELARMLVGEFGIRADLTVVPMRGWTRDRWFEDTGVRWLPPSPAMPFVATATHYPGTCLFEGTNLSVGRGTPIPFEQIGAPWLDADALVLRLNARAMPGVRFEAVRFTPESPSDRKFDGEAVRGIRFVATDRERYDPTLAAIAALVEIRRAHPDRLDWHVRHFDRLAGTDRVRLAVQRGGSVEEITADWARQVEEFRERRERYLLYR